MTSCAEWTGVLLSVLLKECGVKGWASWFVAEGTEEVKGASSMPIAKAMDDCLVAYGMNGEAVRPQNGFPLRLMVPGFEGIFHTKWLRRIKLVDRYYMNYNDYGHLDRDPKVAALDYQIGPKSVITFPFRRTTAARPRILRDQRPGLVRWRRHSRRWRSPPTAASAGTTPRSRGRRSAWRTRGSAYQWNWDGQRDGVHVALHGRTGSGSTVASPGRQALEQAAGSLIQRAGTGQHDSARGGSPAMGACTMGVLRVLPFVLLMGVSALAQSPTYGVGRTPSAEEIRAWDISIGPTGEELPPGRGTAKEGAQLYRAKGCAGCHGATGIGGTAPILKSKAGPDAELWARGRILPLRSPFATTVWDYINRAMPLNREGTLTADEVYALTAFLLYINGVIPEDEVLDAQSLPKVKMPIGDRLRFPA